MNTLLNKWILPIFFRPFAIMITEIIKSLVTTSFLPALCFHQDYDEIKTWENQKHVSLLLQIGSCL